MLKKCSKCNIEKDVNEFYKSKSTEDGLQYYCKDCKYEINKIWRIRNRKKVNRKAKEYKHKNKDRINACRREFHQENKDEINKYRREQRYLYKDKEKEYYENNKGKIYEYQKKHRKDNPHIRLSRSVSSCIRHSLRNSKNGCHWENIVGYTLWDLTKHLESKFMNGMYWHSYGKWHIHHIIPISLWKFESYNDREFKQCWALCNLQPMWKEDNLSKGNRMLPQPQRSVA